MSVTYNLYCNYLFSKYFLKSDPEMRTSTGSESAWSSTSVGSASAGVVADVAAGVFGFAFVCGASTFAFFAFLPPSEESDSSAFFLRLRSRAPKQVINRVTMSVSHTETSKCNVQEIIREHLPFLTVLAGAASSNGSPPSGVSSSVGWTFTTSGSPFDIYM